MKISIWPKDNTEEKHVSPVHLHPEGWLPNLFRNNSSDLWAGLHPSLVNIHFHSDSIVFCHRKMHGGTV